MPLAVQVAAVVTVEGVADGNRAVGIFHQSEVHLSTAGDEHLFGTTHTEGASGILAVAICQQPLAIVLRLDEHIAVFGEGGCQLAIHKLVDAHVLIITLAAVVCAVDVANQVVGVVNGYAGIGRAAGGTLAATIAVSGGRNDLGEAVVAEAAGVGHGAVGGTGGSGGHLGGVAVSAALRTNLILIQLQVGNIAGAAHIGGSVSAELSCADGEVDAAGGDGRMENNAGVTVFSGPHIGIGRELEVGAGVVGQVLTVNADGHTAIHHIQSPDRQIAAGDQRTVDGDGCAVQLTAGQGSTHCKRVGAVVGHDHILAGFQLGSIKDPDITGVGNAVVGIGCATDGTAAV